MVCFTCCNVSEVYFCPATEEEEPDHYSRLQNLPEDVYSEACYTDPPFKTKPGIVLYKNVCVYCMTETPTDGMFQHASISLHACQVRECF